MIGAASSRFVMLLITPFPPLLHRSSSSSIFLCPFIRRLPITTTRNLTFSASSTLILPTINSSLAAHQKFHAHALNSHGETAVSPNKAAALHPWPEWSHLVNALLSSQWNLSPAAEGHGILPEDAFVVYEEKELPEEFIRAASVYLAFSRARPDLLELLSRRDIEVIVTNGTPFLFKSAFDASRRMRAYLGIGEGNVLQSDKANTVDIMKYILSYASNPSVSSKDNNLYDRELVETSVRNLLCQMTDVGFGDLEVKIPAPEQCQFYAGNEHTPRPLRQNVEMKRGDWICPKCSFMNFARNFRCLECEEPRPKRQLTGREWQCQQCNFFNYGRNFVCLRCDCKRPGEATANNVHSMSGLGEMGFSLPENEEKANHWFSKVSVPGSGNNLGRADVDEVFPDIMPLRKGEDKFVASTRKTPLERRHANFQNEKPMGGYRVSEGTNKVLDSSVRRSLDQILGGSAPGSGTDNHIKANEQNIDVNSSASFSRSTRPEYRDNEDLCGNPENLTDSLRNDNNQAEKSDKWFRRVAELHNVKDLPSAILDEDFPEIMPMRKGENQFVVSKKKDRSLTSPAYKRQVATEQASDSKFVPFVPFPPGYFARKDTPAPEDKNSSKNPLTGASSSSLVTENFSDKLEDAKHRVPENNAVQGTQSQARGSGDWSSKFSGDQGTALGGNSSQNTYPFQPIENEIPSSRNSIERNVRAGVLPQLSNQNVSTGWTGKSLEGSAVKEPDHLDMSEEAKTERWFRRVAQIKDISELSQIPDEDFPSIMPQRKGVNRFVVSKRKTPLERRLTSRKYKRNLPTVNSDPMEKHKNTK